VDDVGVGSGPYIRIAQVLMEIRDNSMRQRQYRTLLGWIQSLDVWLSNESSIVITVLDLAELCKIKSGVIDTRIQTSIEAVT
jgi:hypothetical protein